MLRAVVFVNGDQADLRLVKRKISSKDLITAVDGGLKYVLSLGLKPDLVIGDMDSVDKKKLKPDWLVIEDNNTDITDLETALRYISKKQIKEVVVVGFQGSRFDQMTTNLLMLAKSDFKTSIIEGNQEMFLVKDKLEISGKKGDLVSLVPLFKKVKKVETKGLRWNLQGRTLKVGQGLGVSNVMIGKKARVKIGSGVLLVIQTYLL